ncbi:g5980 [Coccomyxa viridis]|uniref:G5980 protein n=1 Tax=Coccomyxa viridis TaxID=1274662 RepID=A0ABP1FWR9_9CHLO
MSKICSHCGASQSVCWRRGPEDKPLLCNACGARYLVKRSLEGYFPHSRPVSKKAGTAPKQTKSGRKQQTGQLGLRNSTAHFKKQRSSSRSARASPKGSTDSGSRSTSTFVSRGTQTIPLFLPSIATFQEIGSQTSNSPSLFTMSAAKQLQGCGGDDFSGLAVSALTLLRHSDNSSGSADLGAVTPVQIVRRHQRKPPKATIRALF